MKFYDYVTEELIADLKGDDAIAHCIDCNASIIINGKVYCRIAAVNENLITEELANSDETCFYSGSKCRFELEKTILVDGFEIPSNAVRHIKGRLLYPCHGNEE